MPRIRFSQFGTRKPLGALDGYMPPRRLARNVPNAGRRTPFIEPESGRGWPIAPVLAALDGYQPQRRLTRTVPSAGWRSPFIEPEAGRGWPVAPVVAA